MIGEKFEPRYFNGKYKLYDDGRRSGELVTARSAENKDITGWYYSDKDGQKYEVSGTAGRPLHSITLQGRVPAYGAVVPGPHVHRRRPGDHRLIPLGCDPGDTGFYASD